MKKSLDHLPEKKQKELHLVADYIKTVFDPYMVILYGSYSRGDWVDIEREYQSDYDILIACSHKKKKNYELRDELEKRVHIDDDIAIKVSFHYEQISVINTEIKKYNYLFIDIRREGVLLYSNGEYELEDVKDLEPKGRYEKAIRDSEHWLNSSKELYRNYHNSLILSKDSDSKQIALNICAFMLHQTTEHLYMAILLVYSGYKPKSHDLEELERMVVPFYEDIFKVFPRKTDKEKHLYDLLRKAYVDARYDMDYSITIEELKTLEPLIEKFRMLTIKLCDRKLKELQDTV